VTDRSGSHERFFWLSFGTSLAIHIGIAAYLLTGGAVKLGHIETPTLAISVNLERTDILDALEQGPAQEAAAAPMTPPAETTPPDVEPDKAVAETEPAVEPVETKPPPEQPERDEDREREQIADEALRRAIAAEAERQRTIKRRQLAEAEAERIEEQRETERKARRKRPSAPASAGASGSQGAKPSKGRISASQGAVTNYAATVRARIARNKPQSPDGKGSVVVSFALSTSGGLIFVRVAASSGNPSLDRSAVSAVRQSLPFPRPPPGSTPSQLRFTMPFYFR
jgi:periplasmic protein TonB